MHGRHGPDASCRTRARRVGGVGPGRRASPAAKPAQQSLERVNVSGALDDSARRRTETASKIVFSRAELDRFGDTSVAEMLAPARRHLGWQPWPGR